MCNIVWSMTALQKVQRSELWPPLFRKIKDDSLYNNVSNWLSYILSRQAIVSGTWRSCMYSYTKLHRKFSLSLSLSLFCPKIDRFWCLLLIFLAHQLVLFASIYPVCSSVVPLTAACTCYIIRNLHHYFHVYSTSRWPSARA